MSHPVVLAILRADHPDAVTEHRFHPTRKWRFDFAIPSARLAIEIDGGVWTSGRHSRGAGQIADMEKLNAAAILGWRVLRFTPQQIPSIQAVAWAAVHHKNEDHQPTDRIAKRQRALERK